MTQRNDKQSSNSDIDDRLRGAYQRQLTQVQQQTKSSPVPTSPKVRPSWKLAMPTLVTAAAAVFIGFGMYQIATRDSDTFVDSANNPATETTPTSEAKTNNPTPTSTESASQTSASETADSETTDSATSQTADLFGHGAPNDVCPTRRRAKLEGAELSYMGDNTGWDRLDDLVDEQEGPYYMTWEPNYPDPVTVSVRLEQPVMATEIRVAQDPITPVDGIISIAIDEAVNDLTLSGLGGWKVLSFDEPRRLDDFTISRDSVGANIVELLVCIEAQ